MPGPATRATFRGRISSAVLCCGALCFGTLAGSLYAQNVAIHSETTRVPHRQAAPSQSQAQSQSLQRLVSPMGSATGAPPGYYQRALGGWHGPSIEYGLPVVPYVFYVGQPLYQPPPAPEPQVVVVNQVTVNNPPPVIERVVVREERPAPRVEPEPPRAPRPTKPQRVVFEIAPADALLKIDGRKLGTAAEVLSRSEPFELAPGVYILQVEHPTYKAQRLVFGVSAELVRVEVDLTSEEPSLRARVR